MPIVAAFQSALNTGMLLPSERGIYYFAFDMKQLLKGDILKRYQAYRIALQSRFMQPNEVRYEEDFEPYEYDFITLGLSDVLLDLKNKTIYTPNTNQTVKFGESVTKQNIDNQEQGAIIEDRYNDGSNYTKDEHGRFTGSTGTGGSSGGGGGSSGGGKISYESGIIKLNDIQIFHSVGAKAKNYDILDPDTGGYFKFVEGTKIQNAQIFAGKGCKKPLKNEVAYGLEKQIGGKASNWQHAKGNGIIDYYGEERKAEVHWFQEETVGKHKFKIKRWLDDEG